MDFEIQLAGFIEGSQKLIDQYHVDCGFAPLQGKKLILMRGKKNIRIVAKDVWDGVVREESGSAWAFIDLATGAIYKAASWAAPAKHARGNIMEADFGLKYIGKGAYMPGPITYR